MTGSTRVGKASSSITDPPPDPRPPRSPCDHRSACGRAPRAIGRLRDHGWRPRKVRTSHARTRLTPATPSSKRVVVADGAMGTMLQAADPSLDDFQGYEGCNEVLNVTRPELVAGVHDAYFAVGVDCVETNTFGANLANLGEYGISERIFELAEAGARDRPSRSRTAGRLPRADRAGCSGSVGPGHEASEPGPCTLRCAPGRLPAAGRGPGGRRRRRHPDRDRAGPAAGEGGHHRRPPRPCRGGHRPAGLRPGHRRDHRHDAARQRDRRGPHGACARWAST